MPSRIVSPAFMKTGACGRGRHRRRSRRDDVAGFQLHEAARIGDDVGAGKIIRVVVPSAPAAVQVEPEVELLRITHSSPVTSQDRMGRRSDSSCPSTTGPPIQAGTRARKVVEDGEARDVGEGFHSSTCQAVRPITKASSTSQSSFTEPRRQDDVVVGAAQGARVLVEDDRLRGDGGVRSSAWSV